jgi:TDG/mug DNA glycosylase family protein
MPPGTKISNPKPLASRLESAASLPDLLRENLDIVFVGINPSVYSVAQGHYFARKTNRFWPCFSRSFLSRSARDALGVTCLEPSHDRALLDHGFGFTDAVKRATPRASDISAPEFSAATADLVAKLEHFRPKLACFHGIMAYRRLHRLLTDTRTDPKLGAQSMGIGPTKLYVIPNPSPANAHFTQADMVRWYDHLAAELARSPN